MGFFNKYPYTDFHELNLDYVLNAIKIMKSDIENFINFNSIKYADPLAWNITTQYAANTVVIDPATGIAYLSTQAVPSGVVITDQDYWTAIFDMSQFFADLGDINDLLTTDKTSVVNAINEIFAYVQTLNKKTPFVTPEMFGAVSDGSTDATQAFDDAINTGLPVLLSTGTYLLETLTITGRGIHIQGAGKNTTLLVRNINITDGNDVNLSNMMILAKEDVTDLIKVSTSYHVTFDHVYISSNDYNVVNGIHFDGSSYCYYCSFLNGTIAHFEVGALIDHSANANTIQNNEMYDNDRCIKIDSCNGLSLISNKFQSYKYEAITMTWTSGSRTTGNAIIANYFEGTDSADLICDINLNNDPEVFSNFIIGNNITYRNKPHVYQCNVGVSQTILDYTAQSTTITGRLPGFTGTRTFNASGLSSYRLPEIIGAMAPTITGKGGTIEMIPKTLMYDSDGTTLQWTSIITADPHDNRDVTYYSETTDSKMYVQVIRTGTSAQRPSYKTKGYCYFDTDLNKPIWYVSGTTWVDATGAVV